jgi:hypothetical protein
MLLFNTQIYFFLFIQTNDVLPMRIMANKAKIYLCCPNIPHALVGMRCCHVLCLQTSIPILPHFAFWFLLRHALPNIVYQQPCCFIFVRVWLLGKGVEVPDFITKGFMWQKKLWKWRRKFGQRIKISGNTNYHLTEFRFFDGHEEEIKL